MQSHLLEHYGIEVSDFFQYGTNAAFRFRDVLYLIVEVSQMEQKELEEIKQLADALQQQGESTIGKIVSTRAGEVSFAADGYKWLLIEAPNRAAQRVPRRTGEELAYIHRLGFSVSSAPFTHRNRFEGWYDYWITRLDSLEKWREAPEQRKHTPFEEQFQETFPYYLGLAENAIQYLVDTEIDDKKQANDRATIAHHRFNRSAWLEYGRIKLPHQWVWDHPARDVAEWIRSEVFVSRHHSSHTLLPFLQEYQQRLPLSRYGWRQVYARLLFPVHYFEAIETFYSTDSSEVQASAERELLKMMDSAEEYEQTLTEFPQAIYQLTGSIQIPYVDWLIPTKK